MFDPSLYFVTPSIWEDFDAWENLIKEAVIGGVTAVQIRDKTADAKRIIEAGKRLQPFLQERGVPLLINDRADIALILSAEGLHIGQSDMTAEMARTLLGEEAIIGISIENMNQLETANGATYIAASPVFRSRTKKSHSEWGLEGLATLRKSTSMPLVAIGGIQEGHLKSLARCGADGIAVISAIASSPNPRLAAEALIKKWKNCKREKNHY